MLGPDCELCASMFVAGGVKVTFWSPAQRSHWFVVPSIAASSEKFFCL